MSTAKAPLEACPPQLSQLLQPKQAQTPVHQTTQEAFSKQSSVHRSTSKPLQSKKSEEAPRTPQKPGNQWLQTALKDTPLATMTQLYQCFASLPNCQSMHSHYITDLASHKGNQSCLCNPHFTCTAHDGWWGGGLRHVTKRAKCQNMACSFLVCQLQAFWDQSTKCSV